MILLIFMINYPANLPGWRFFGTIIALLSLLILNIVWVNPSPGVSAKMRTAQDWGFLIISSMLILATVWFSGQINVAYLQSIVCIQADFKRGVWPAGVVFSAVMLVVWLGVQIALGATFTAIVAVGTFLAAGFVFGLILMTLLERYAYQTKRAESLLKELQAANLVLEAARQNEKDLAIAEERVRLARDIHDGLGHHLTVLSIQLQAAGKLVERNPQAAGEAIQVCRSEAQAALEEVRRSVSLMRQPLTESKPLAETLAALVQSFGMHTGLQASFNCSGDPLEISSFAGETFYRVVQEGLTNVQKHAKNAQKVSVRLEYLPESVQLSVEDDGQALVAEAPSRQAGFGLNGLRERVSQLGGAFQSGPGKTGGYEIKICIPSQGNEKDPGSSS
jgi:signal transduction histidine kinase